MYDLSDSSWKVRRSAVKVTDTLILTHPELLRYITETLFDSLIKRFFEQESNVKLATFQTLSDFLKMVTYGEGSNEPDNNIEDLINNPTIHKLKPSFSNLYEKITNIVPNLIKVFNDQKSISSLKIAAAELLIKTTRCVPDSVIQHLDSVFKVIETNYSQSGNSDELKMDMLKVVRAVLEIQICEPKPQIERLYDRINKLIFGALDNQNFKISSEAYKGLTVFFKALRPSLSDSSGKFAPYVKPVIGKVVQMLKESDIDEEVILLLNK